jgi:phage shock protein C
MSGSLRGLVAALAGRDAYELLTVPDTASPERIRQAYRVLLKEWHSDRHPGASAEEKTKLLNIAWEILRDHRAEYDKLRGHAADDAGGAAGQRDGAEAFDDPWLGATTGMAPPPSWQRSEPPPHPTPSWRPEPPPEPPPWRPQSPPRRDPPSGYSQRGLQENSPQRLRRSRSDREIAGVCSGVARYLGIDPVIVRVIVVLGSMATFGFGAVIYAVAALAIPEEGQDTSAAQDAAQKYAADNRK